MLVQPVLDLVARAAGFGEGKPVAAGGVAGLRVDLDDVAVAQLGAERDDAAVDLRADGRVADLGVDRIGEVDGAGILGQDDDLALGGEGVDLFRVQVDFERRHELVGVGHLLLPFHELAHPGEALLVLGGDGVAGLVLPVRGDSLFGDLVHVLGAHLDLKLVAAGSDQRGVQRLVLVGPRHGDEVLDAAGNGRPLAVQEAEDGPAIGLSLADDAHGQQVVHLVDGDLLRDELLVNGVQALDAPLDPAGFSIFGERSLDFCDDAGEKLFIGAAQVFDLLLDLLVGDGVGVAGRRGLRARRAACPCPAGARAARRCPAFRGRSCCCFSGFRCWSVRMLCRRSASLMMTTRTSVTMARSILRMFSAWWSSRAGELDLVELGDAFDDVSDLAR